MAATGVRREEAATALRHAAGAAEFIGRLGSEITSLVQDVHAASSPLSMWTGVAPASAVYASIRFGFRSTSRLAALGGRIAGDAPAPDTWLDVQSALNGAFGHLFAESRGGFALPMSLHRQERERPGRPLVLFLHGLCMNERAWQKPAHARFVSWVRRSLGAGVAYLRYNSGLHVSTNGALLADLLAREAPERELILVGHSMGGLVAVSALHQAGERGDAWRGRVTGLACLGSPHEGASLERLGNHANRLLKVSPWTRPFMRLGNLRSDGIRDLRFGHVLEEDWRERPLDDPRRAHSRAALASHVDHLFLAAAVHPTGRADPRGDWLVPVESALAVNLHPGEGARRELLPGLDHLGLLADERVYRSLRRWLGGRRPPERSAC